jgi:hypothetical protein
MQECIGEGELFRAVFALYFVYVPGWERMYCLSDFMSVSQDIFIAERLGKSGAKRRRDISRYNVQLQER